MEKILYLILSEQDGKKLKEIFRDMKCTNVFYGFVDKCIKKYDYKMGLKDKIYHPNEKPEICKAAIKIEYDDYLKELLLSDESKEMFGKEIYEQFAYRFLGILPYGK